MIEDDDITKEFKVYAGRRLYIKYNNTCSTVSKLNVFKTDSRFDSFMLLVLENKK